jgi:hypothetical protein
MKMSDLSLQVLVSTMHQTDHSLLDKMNIQTDAIVINQCDRNKIEEFDYNGHQIQWLSLKERGVGLSRNSALARGTADILLFADDDVIYDDQYSERVLDFFEKHPSVGLVVFNLESLNPDRPEYIIRKKHRLRWYNCLRYGAFRIAVRRECLVHNNVWFSLLFGGGATYQAGEDNLFITNCIQKGIHCMACKDRIGVVKQETSTWFKGYNEKYYRDRGALFAALYGKMAYLMLFLFELRNKKGFKKILERLKLGYAGIKRYLTISRCKA